MSKTSATPKRPSKIVRPAIIAGGVLVAASFALALNFSANFAEPELVSTATAGEVEAAGDIEGQN